MPRLRTRNRPDKGRRVARALPAGLPENTLIKNPAGTYSFVGRVDTRLAFVTKNGGVPTAKQLDGARHAGPGIVGLRTRTFPTSDAALKAARALGLSVSDGKGGVITP